MTQAKLDLGALQAQLPKIKKQITRFEGTGYKAALAAAQSVYDVTEKAITTFSAANLSQKDFDAICSEFDTTIKTARIELENHRGWKKIVNTLASILVSILTLGFANWVTDKFLLFSTQTNSELMLDELQPVFQSTANQYKSSHRIIDEASEEERELEPPPRPQTVSTHSSSRPPASASESNPSRASLALQKLMEESIQSINKLVQDYFPQARLTLGDYDSLLQQARKLAHHNMSAIQELNTINNRVMRLTALIQNPRPSADAEAFRRLLIERYTPESTPLTVSASNTAQPQQGYNAVLSNPVITSLIPLAHKAGASFAPAAFTVAAYPFKKFYAWNPYEPGTMAVINSISTQITNFNALSSTFTGFANRYYGLDFPRDQFTINPELAQTPALKQSINVVAILKDMAHVRLDLPLTLAHTAHYTKLLRDLNFCYLGRGFDWGQYLAKGGFILMTAHSATKLLKGGMELYKNRALMDKPLEIAGEAATNLFKSSGPWPAANFEERKKAYIVLYNTLLGKGDKYSSFELRIQNLFYNMLVGSGNLNGLALAKLGALAHHPYHGASNWWNGLSDEYTWYPEVFQTLASVLPELIHSSVQTQLNGLFNPFTQTVMSHLINKFIWSEGIKPIFLELPMQGLTTAALRLKAEQYINNPNFIPKFRLVMEEALKGLFTDVERLDFVDFTPPNKLDKAMKSALLTTEIIGMLSNRFLGSAPQQEPVVLNAPDYIGYNPVKRAIAALNYTPLQASSKGSTMDLLVDGITATLEGNLHLPALSAYSKGRMQESILERYLCGPFVNCVTSTYAAAYKSYINPVDGLLVDLTKASTLSDLPTQEDMDAFTLEIDQKGRRWLNKNQAKINEMNTLYTAQRAKLTKQLEDAREETRQAYALFNNCKSGISVDPTTHNIPAQATENIELFRSTVGNLIQKYSNDAEASKITKLLATLPEILDASVAQQQRFYLNEVCYRIFQQFIVARSPQHSDKVQISAMGSTVLRSIAQENHTNFIRAIEQDISSLDSIDSPVLKNYIDRMIRITGPLSRLEQALLPRETSPVLSYDNLIELLGVYDIIFKDFKTLAAPSASFIDAIQQQTQEKLASVGNQLNTIRNALIAVDKEFEPIDALFKQLANPEHVQLPTPKQITHYETLMAAAHPEGELPLITEYRNDKRADKKQEHYNHLFLIKLDNLIKIQKESFQLRAGSTSLNFRIIEEAASNLDNAVAAALNNSANESLKQAIRDRVERAKTEWHNVYDAADEITTHFRDLRTHLDYINNNQTLMLSWFGSSYFFIDNEAQQTLIENLSNSLSPYSKYHEKEYSTVLSTQLGVEPQVIREQGFALKGAISLYLTNHIKQHIGILINNAIRTYIGGLNKASVNTTEDKTNCILSVASGFTNAPCIALFGTADKIRSIIEDAVKAPWTDLINEKVELFKEEIKSRLITLNSDFQKTATSGYFGFFATVPLTQVQYDDGITLLKAEINSFEPAEKQGELYAFLNTLVIQPPQPKAHQAAL